MTTTPAISINGTFFSPEDARVSVFDHGFLYGDGVFEGIRVYGTRIFRGERHVRRLFRSAKVLDLKIVQTQEEVLEEIKKVSRKWAEINNVDLSNNGDPLYIRVIVSRGDGDLGLDPRKCPQTKLVVIVDRIKLYPKEHYEKGLTLVTTAITRTRPDSLPPQVKSLNYACNILAKMDANRENAAEAIFFNHMGYVAEATADNIFIVSEGELITPPVSDGALPGITRETVLQLAEKNGIPNREAHVTLADLYNADECFLTGTAARVVPVTTINSRTIGTGERGPITYQLMEAYVKRTETDGVLIYD
ncbi:MAG: branched-chain-amino-acid transaminase [Candidatus Omnitrophica bacterium]|nr:branched-chain-amino-acid transaminase [Candidatus Omnitrophota bacterium]